MLHTFKCLDRFLLLDIESGAVHVVDEITHDVQSFTRIMTAAK